MYDKNAHLTWYDLYDPTPDPTRTVTYQDQFGKQMIYTGRATRCWCRPRRRSRAASSRKRLDHYKVYQVLHGEPVDEGGRSSRTSSASRTSRSTTRMFFAVPVKKWYQGQTYGINNPNRPHLVIYRTYPQTTEKTIMTRDQFSQRYQNVFRSVLLGSPCKKLDWKASRLTAEACHRPPALLDPQAFALARRPAQLSIPKRASTTLPSRRTNGAPSSRGSPNAIV